MKFVLLMMGIGDVDFTSGPDRGTGNGWSLACQYVTLERNESLSLMI